MQALAYQKQDDISQRNQSQLERLFPEALSVPHTPLTDVETQQAKTAWAYFDSFANIKTGFCPTAEGDRRITPWEFGANLLAIVSAGRLGILAPSAVQARLNTCIESLIDLSLTTARLPNAHYRCDDLKMTNRSVKPAPQGTGWSPARVMRLVAGLIVTAHYHPDLAPLIALILKKWRLDDLVRHGRFLASQPGTDGSFIPVQQGILGYEQYAARCGLLINLPLQAALDMRPILRGQWHNGMLLPGDKRLIDGRSAVITPEPFCLEALEFGWRDDMLEVALTLFVAQKSRFEQSGTLTALTEDALDQPPGFAFHGILAGQEPFTSYSTTGRNLSHLRCLSTKAAFCWWALLRTPYSQKLVDYVTPLQSAKGWFTGRYEANGHTNRIRSLNTNAVILEALHYKAFGPLFPAA